MVTAYPPVAFSFALSFSGAAGPAGASFLEVSGLEAERKIEEIKEGGENRSQHSLPGRTKMGNVVLKRGSMAASSTMFDWCRTTLDADLMQRIQTRDVTISLQNAQTKPTIRWSVSAAWPVKWSAASLGASDGQVAIEALELSFQTLTRIVENELGS